MKPKADVEAVTAYIDAASEPARTRLRELRAVIRKEAPEAIERIAYGLATWHQGENLIHLGAFANHIGIYPGAAAMVAFAKDLTGFKTSKGTIQVPHDMKLPTELVRKLTRWRVAQVTAKKPASKKPTSVTKLASKKSASAKKRGSKTGASAKD